MNDGFNPDTITEIPFELAGKVFRSPMPFNPGDEYGELFEAYKLAGIQSVVLLLPRDEMFQKSGRDLTWLYQQAGVQVIHMPIQDFSTPDLSSLNQALDQAIALARSGKNIAVHCYAGFGRTGTFLACMAVRLWQFTGQQAVDWVRQFVPPALENKDQVLFVYKYGDQNADQKC